MRPDITLEAAVKDLNARTTALETLQTSTASNESKRVRLLEENDGSLSDKFLAQFAAIEAGATASKLIEPIMLDRLRKSVEIARRLESYVLNDTTALHALIDDGIESFVMAQAPEDLRGGLNVWGTRTAIEEKKARPALSTTWQLHGEEVREVVSDASSLAANLLAIAAEHKRAVSVAKRFGVSIPKAA